MKPYLSVIIPAYNESKRLPQTLIDVDRHLSKADYSYEIIVVNDGSTDDTADIVKRFSHLVKNLRLIDNEKNHGKGWVVRQGMLEAKGNWRLFTDADNSTAIDHFDKMIPYLREYEVVFGSRDVAGAKMVPPQPFYKRKLGDISNIIIQVILWEFLRGIWDTQCGFKCFSEEAAKKVFGLAKIDRWGFDFEALALAKKLGYKTKEIPVIWVNNPYSSVKLMSYLRTFWDLLRVRWWLWRRKYAQ